MSVDNRELEEFQRKLADLKEQVPEFLRALALGEGVHAASEARRICKAEGIVNTGNYRENWHAGDRRVGTRSKDVSDGCKARARGKTYSIDVYNNAEYAKHLEYGFRSHFVPGYWAGKTFIYQPGYPGGMWVGPHAIEHHVNRETASMDTVQVGYVKGHFTMMRAKRNTLKTQPNRLRRKQDKFLREGLK